MSDEVYYIMVLPEEFLEAVEILLDGDAAIHQATENVETLKEALKVEFPIQNRRKCAKRDPIVQAITGRASSSVLWKGKAPIEKPVQVITGIAVNSLSPLEKTVLSGIVSAFVEGLFDAELRSLATRRPVMG
ncbi:hypothetical protein OnM2_000033 [Erysiphe neolycopersici]|uniref:Uncharacterized protein n=1 Tax=Erysiphe neolycopersici TaxID=212602 RepID=A0A420I8L8_9PEZI|nr:hypothetical protein OnM2_000033 [Erysiphe neolycopersici]